MRQFFIVCDIFAFFFLLFHYLKVLDTYLYSTLCKGTLQLVLLNEDVYFLKMLKIKNIIDI